MAAKKRNYTQVVPRSDGNPSPTLQQDRERVASIPANPEYDPAAEAWGGENNPAPLCVSCGGAAGWTVGWLLPTKADAHTETADNRPVCGTPCAVTARSAG